MNNYPLGYHTDARRPEDDQDDETTVEDCPACFTGCLDCDGGKIEVKPHVYDWEDEKED